MQQTSTQQNQGPKLTFNEEKYPPVEITREFSAPVERLWKAWTTPELLKQWWGPEAYSCPDARVDVRVGGKSLMAMKGPDGKVLYSGGTYEEVIPNEKLVTTDQFMDKHGLVMTAKEVGMPGDWPEAGLVTMTFKSLGADESYLHIIHQGIPKEMHDDCVGGWSSSIDKLQKLVEHI